MCFVIKKNQSGFTLMELMIIIIIIGVLASFALPNYRNTINRSRRRDAEAQLIALHGANQMYRAQNDEFLQGTHTIVPLNDNLKINLIENGLTFSYTSNATNTFTATATCASPAYVITIDENAIVPGSNPSCAGACP